MAHKHKIPDRTRATRWEHEEGIENFQTRLDKNSEVIRIRRETAEQPFGTIEDWASPQHFKSRTLARSKRETDYIFYAASSSS